MSLRPSILGVQGFKVEGLKSLNRNVSLRGSKQKGTRRGERPQTLNPETFCSDTYIYNFGGISIIIMYGVKYYCHVFFVVAITNTSSITISVTAIAVTVTICYYCHLAFAISPTSAFAITIALLIVAIRVLLLLNEVFICITTITNLIIIAVMAIVVFLITIVVVQWLCFSLQVSPF